MGKGTSFPTQNELTRMYLRQHAEFTCQAMALPHGTAPKHSANRPKLPERLKRVQPHAER
jgi:hypothetical protein